MAWWKSDKSQETPAKKCGESALRALFADATHGAMFHSSAYVLDNNLHFRKLEWLEAHAVPGKGWKIMRLEQFDDGAQKPRIRRNDIEGKAGLPFIDAVEFLNDYEASQPLLGHWLCENPPPDAAKNETHVRAFAEAEGIVFDDANVPHPTTQDGRIICAGVFAADAGEKALAAAAQRTVKLSLTFQKLPAVELKSVTVPELAEMVRILKDYRDFARNAEEDQWCTLARTDRENCYDDQFFGEKYKKFRKDYEDNLEKLFWRRGFQQTPGLRENLQKAFNACELAAMVSYAREARQYAPKRYIRSSEYTYSKRHSRIARKCIAECIQSLGLAPGERPDLVIDSLVHPSASGDFPARKMDAVVDWLVKLQEDILAQMPNLALQARIAVKPAPPPVMPPHFAC